MLFQRHLTEWKSRPENLDEFDEFIDFFDSQSAELPTPDNATVPGFGLRPSENRFVVQGHEKS